MKPKILVMSLFMAMTAYTVQAQSAHKKKVLRKKTTSKIQYGTASYYSSKFQGRKTASGELYDQVKFTAAHNGLPMGTWIKVTNLNNHRSVVVRINDRLHYKNPRLVDLSRAAARKLGYIARGITRVKVEVLEKKPPVIYDESANK